MNVKWVLGTILTASALSASASGQVSIGVTIGTPPPPVQYEVAPPMPAVGYVWTNGYWAPYGGRYVWHRGYWVRERHGRHYTPARWEQDGNRWRYHNGRWDR